MASIHERRAVERYLRGRRVDPYHLKRFRHDLYRRSLEPGEALLRLPETEREGLRRRFQLSELALVERQPSRADGACKLVLRTEQGRLLETVILASGTGRTTLCISSQIGCAARCRFCATGTLPTVTQLSAGQMLEQVALANRLLRLDGRRARNLVFMGMGEPLHNEVALYETLAELTAPDGFAYPPRRLLVSTVGVPDAMVRLANRFPGVPLAVSLHSARQELREQLIPIARRHPLGRLREALVEVAERQNRSVLIEYLMLRELNDQHRDAVALVEYLRGLPVHVNLIPYNAIPEAPELQSSERPRRDRFAGWLREAGVPVTIRYSLGADVAAACGQLALRSV